MQHRMPLGQPICSLNESRVSPHNHGAADTGAPANLSRTQFDSAVDELEPPDLAHNPQRRNYSSFCATICTRALR